MNPATYRASRRWRNRRAGRYIHRDSNGGGRPHDVCLRLNDTELYEIERRFLMLLENFGQYAIIDTLIFSRFS